MVERGQLAVTAPTVAPLNEKIGERQEEAVNTTEWDRSASVVNRGMPFHVRARRANAVKAASRTSFLFPFHCTLRPRFGSAFATEPVHRGFVHESGTRWQAQPTAWGSRQQSCDSEIKLKDSLLIVNLQETTHKLAPLYNGQPCGSR